VSNVTRILDRVQQGEARAAEELLPLVYEDLRHLAAVKMLDQAAGHTLQPTAFVHEAWLRLAGSQHKDWQGKRAITLWDIESQQEVVVLEGEGSNSWRSESSPDGNVFGSENMKGILHLWRAPSWAEIQAAEKQESEDAQPRCNLRSV